MSNPNKNTQNGNNYRPSVVGRIAQTVSRALRQEKTEVAQSQSAKDSSHARVGRVLTGMVGESPTRQPNQIQIEDAGEQLGAYIDKLMAQKEGADPRFTDRSVAMARLLARRIGAPAAITPSGYVMAKELLKADCQGNGIDGFGEPMPKEIMGGSKLEYTTFCNVQAIDLARGAFGDEFADQVQEFQRSVDV